MTVKKTTEVKKPDLSRVAQFAAQEAPQSTINTQATRTEPKPAKAAQEPSRRVSAQGNVMWGPPAGQRRLTVNIDVEAHKALKLAAVEDETTVSDILAHLVAQYLANRK